MNLLEFFGIVGSLVGSLGGIMYWFISRLEKDMQRIGDENNRKIDAIDRKTEAFERRMDGHAARIDQLYLMFVDLVKK